MTPLSTSRLNAALNEALGLLRAGRLAETEQVLSKLRAEAPQAPDVWRLSGAAARGRGEPETAAAHLRKAVRLAPRHHEAWNTLGLALGDLDDAAGAVDAFEKALTLKPDFAPAAINLARRHLADRAPRAALDVIAPFAGRAPQAAALHVRALREAEEVEAAFAAAEAALARWPGDARLRYGAGQCLLELGRPSDALTALEGVAEAGLTPAHYARFAALARLHRFGEAERAVEAALAADPTDPAALHGAAQMRWMTGRGDEIAQVYETALERSGGALLVYTAYLDTLTQMARLDEARALLRRAWSARGGDPQLSDRAITIEVEAGDAAAALDAARRAADRFPDSALLWANRARAHLMAGEADAARALTRAGRRSRPHDQFWIAMDATAARLQRDLDYEALYDVGAFTLTQALEPPAHYGGLAAFNAQLAETLRRLHDFSVAPLDQSLREGAQTPTDLRHSTEPVIVDFFNMAETAFNRFRAKLSASGDHPFLSRIPSQFRLQGAWSVKLGPNGRHVNHVHPQGWASSVYYADVPPQVAGSPDKEGWLKFCEPPFPVPGAEPQGHVEPRAGELTLFPSYMWHGTVPIRSGERLTIAFDIAPDREVS